MFLPTKENRGEFSIQSAPPSQACLVAALFVRRKKLVTSGCVLSNVKSTQCRKLLQCSDLLSNISPERQNQNSNQSTSLTKVCLKRTTADMCLERNTGNVVITNLVIVAHLTATGSARLDHVRHNFKSDIPSALKIPMEKTFTYRLGMYRSHQSNHAKLP